MTIVDYDVARAAGVLTPELEAPPRQPHGVDPRGEYQNAEVTSVLPVLPRLLQNATVREATSPFGVRDIRCTFAAGGREELAAVPGATVQPGAEVAVVKHGNVYEVPDLEAASATTGTTPLAAAPAAILAWFENHNGIAAYMYVPQDRKTAWLYGFVYQADQLQMAALWADSADTPGHLADRMNTAVAASHPPTDALRSAGVSAHAEGDIAVTLYPIIDSDQALIYAGGGPDNSVFGSVQS